MSENIRDQLKDVFIDTNPELWDLVLELDLPIVNELKTIIKDYEENYVRKGECNRCGKCCYVHNEQGELVPCKYLIINEDSTTTCELYGKPERPEVCINFPQKDNSHKFPECGYYFEQK